MKTDKSSGWDNIMLEMIKYGGQEIEKGIWYICRDAWYWERMPTDWEKNLDIPIHKKGNAVYCNNYRAIYLSSVVLKIYTHIIENRFRAKVED